MKKVLLSLAAVGLAASVNAQVLNFGFEADQLEANPIADANWESFGIDSEKPSSFDLESADVNSGERALAVTTTGTCETWERVIAVTNVNLEQSKSYRIRFAGKGNAALNVGILMGEFYHDKALINGAGTMQTSNITLEDATNWATYSYVVWSPTVEQMVAAGKDETSTDKYFLRLAFTNEGNYAIDDIVIEESTVQDIVMNSYAVRVDFGYDWNSGVSILPNDCVTLTVDGEQCDVESVEVKDGKFYIFLDEDGDVDLSDAEEVLVSFTNSGDLKYTTAACPTSDGLVCNFTNEKARFVEEEFGVQSYLWEPVKLMNSDPKDDSFENDKNQTRFTFTFDKNVIFEHEMLGNPKATLLGDNVDEELELVAFDAPQPTLTFNRPAGAAPFSKGMYTVKLETVCSEKGIANDDVVVSFEVGEIQLAETIYTDLFTTLLSGAGNGQPTDWSIMVGGADWTGGEPKADNGSACRNLNVTGTDGVEYTAFYLCDRDGYTYMMYGDKEEARITIPAGDIEFSVIGLSHDEGGHTLEYRLEDMDGNEVVHTSGACSVVANNAFTSIAASDHISATFNNPTERNFILKVRAPQGGYTAVRVLGFQARSYVITEGDKDESTEVFNCNFAGANMPAAGTGWLFYENNNQLEPGSGRNGTSGMLERNFHAKMQTAAFFRECGENANAAMRIDYGYGNGVEDGIELAAGSYEIVYYAGTWNDANGNAAGNSKVFFQMIDAETGDVIVNDTHVNIANFENGGACNGQADKIVLAFKPVVGATYKVKAWGTTNTVWGGFSITKEGSKAAKWHKKLNEALETANDEMTTSQDDKYNGTTKTALATAISKYSAVPNGMHTPEEYQAAIAELENLTSALATRRNTIGKYEKAITDITAYLEGETSLAAKYEALECYVTLTETFAIYKSIAAQDLEDEELISATNTLELAYNSTKHMVEVGVPALTAQISALATQLVALDEAQGESEIVIAAGNAVSDDQHIANSLKLELLKAMYTQIATKGEDFFKSVTYDEEYDITITEDKPFDATCFIQNPKVYTTAPKHDACTIANYPGWESDRPEFAMRPNYGWGGWDTNPYYLIHANDMFIGIGWVGNDGVTVTNNATYLPVGNYDLTIATMDRSGAGDWDGSANSWPNPERQLSYIFYQQAEQDTVKQAFNNENLGQYYSFTDDVMENVALDGEVYADVKIGAYIHAQESFAAIRNVRLSLKSAKADFDYAAAATALQGVIDGIEVVEREDAPVNVTFFNLNGQQAEAAQGINIKVERYADGYIVVKKVIVK